MSRSSFHSVLFHHFNLDQILILNQCLEFLKHVFLVRTTNDHIEEESCSGRWLSKTRDVQLYCPWTGLRSRYPLYSRGIYRKLVSSLQSALNVSGTVEMEVRACAFDCHRSGSLPVAWNTEATFRNTNLKYRSSFHEHYPGIQEQLLGTPGLIPCVGSNILAKTSSK